MRFKRLIFAVILACGVAACAKDVTGVTHTPPPLAYVRYINAVSDTFNMDFRAVDQVDLLPAVPQRRVPRPWATATIRGIRPARVTFASSSIPTRRNNTTAVDPTVVSTVMVDTTYTFTAGTYYTLVHVGNARTGAAVPEKLWIIQDALPAQTTSSVQYRVVNVAPVQGAVDVYVRADGTTPLSGTPTASALAFQTATAYLSQAPGPSRHSPDAARHADGGRCGSRYTLQVGTAPARRPPRRLAPDLRFRPGRIDSVRVHFRRVASRIQRQRVGIADTGRCILPGHAAAAHDEPVRDRVLGVSTLQSH